MPSILQQPSGQGVIGRLLLLVLVIVCCSWATQTGCSRPSAQTVVAQTPVVRVRLIANTNSIKLTSGGTWKVTLRSGNSVIPVDASNLQGRTFEVSLNSGNIWQIAGNPLGNVAAAQLHVAPENIGTLALAGKRYRGNIRLVPTSAGRFDVVNELPIDDYLKGVVPREMPAGWPSEALKAQAVVARTYALFEARQRSGNRHWDLFPDTASQVYGGMDDEKPSGNLAVDQTAGLVVAGENSQGQLRIFKAYFSSCCGGITQSSSDAFDESQRPWFAPQDVGDLCSQSSRFRWAERSYSKADLTQRIRTWGRNGNNPVANLSSLDRIDILRRNPKGRPAEFAVTDTSGQRYRLTSEQMRWAINTARPEKEEVLYSGFFTPVNEPTLIRITDGRGWGHGVGMCQWCAKGRADKGLLFERIVRDSFPTAELVRAY
jgi:stage II sporulation protein D